MIKGHCECGSVQYQVDAEINEYCHCHCSQCRRLHGSAFASFGGVPKAGFSYLSGETDISTYASSSTHDRVFCKVCGSNILTRLDDEPDTFYLAMGSVDGNPKCPPGYHIFVGSKAQWYELKDDFPRYDTLPED